MILVAGLTPAWQQIMCFARLRPGEVNRAAEVHWCGSGKAINAAMALASLKVSTHLLSPAGGWSGQAMRAEFTERKTPATWMATHATTRVCSTILNQGDHTTTELVENGSALTEGERTDFIATYRALAARADMAILTGSLPNGTPASFYRTLFEWTPCPVVLDARGPELLETLPLRPLVVKPNREELAMTVGQPLSNRADVLVAMRELIARGAQNVIVTEGKDAVLAMTVTQTWELTPLVVEPVVNPIGCGDCLTAGLAWGLSRGESFVDAVRLGIAAAADNVTQLLPARLSRQRVESQRDLVRVVRLG